MIFMTLQAAIDGLGVAIGRTTYVEGDLAKGRLVVPFDMRTARRCRLLSGVAAKPSSTRGN